MISIDYEFLLTLSAKIVDSKEIHFDYLFAAKDSHESKRPTLTIKPLSKALGLDINTDFKDAEYAKLGDELHAGRYSNKNILVCWHHGKIPELLAAFGRGSSEGTSERKMAGRCVRLVRPPGIRTGCQFANTLSGPLPNRPRRRPRSRL
jgi:hypothetical protein